MSRNFIEVNNIPFVSDVQNENQQYSEIHSVGKISEV